ncbi:MAG: N-acetylmuramoyl-L-alanine amidase [Desulfatirhabdiaceae bacterium]
MVKDHPDSMLNRIFIIFLIVCLATGALTANSAHAASEKDQYQQADACYTRLLNSPEKQKLRHNWLACIQKFQKVHQMNPSGPWAAAGLYMAGFLYEEMYRISLAPADRKEALDSYQRIVNRFAKSNYRKKALAGISRLESPKPETTPPSPPKPEPVSEPAPPIPSSDMPVGPASLPLGTGETRSSIYSNITDLRVWSNPHYTRIVIDADNETAFRHHLLKQDPDLDKPQRLYIDIEQAKLGKHIQNFISVNDNLIQDARAGQYTLDSVRIVADIKSFKTYKIFSLNNPFRIIMDVWGKEPDQPEKPVTEFKPDKKSPKLKPNDLARQLSLGVRRIILDPGHGGKDTGAPGIMPGVYEKDITLAIALRLQKKIQQTLDCEVILTRTKDVYLSLEERTAIANTKNGDLFISIHTNAAHNSTAYGIETFFLNLATDEDAIMVAARENATSTKNISDLQSILTDLMQNAKINESSRLAARVQKSLVANLNGRYNNIRDKGVKKAPFYVLLGAQMPSVLVETSFISNQRECSRLVSPEYQDHLAESITKGVRDYIRDTNPAAFMERHQKTAGKL